MTFAWITDPPVRNARMAVALRLKQDGMTKEQIGRVLGVSGERARQIYEQARRVMRNALAQELGIPPCQPDLERIARDRMAYVALRTQPIGVPPCKPNT